MSTPGPTKKIKVVTPEQEEEMRKRLIRRLHRELGGHCENDAIDDVVEYLETHPVLPEAPILMLQFAPLNPGQDATAPPTIQARKLAIANAITGYAQAHGEVVIDIGLHHSAFAFPDMELFYSARRDLGIRTIAGNVRWAYWYSPLALGQMNAALATIGLPAMAATQPIVASMAVTHYVNSSNYSDYVLDLSDVEFFIH